jgi:hypothetical protein
MLGWKCLLRVRDFHSEQLTDPPGVTLSVRCS